MRTEQEKLDYINSTCNTNYKNIDDVNWLCISIYYILIRFVLNHIYVQRSSAFTTKSHIATLLFADFRIQLIPLL